MSTKVKGDKIKEGSIPLSALATEVKDKIETLVNITYSELKSLRDNSKLIPGQQYRITDYITTTTQNNTQSAGHQFDVIVTADNENTLNEVARACHSDFDLEKYKDAHSYSWDAKMVYVGPFEYYGKEYHLYETELQDLQMLVNFNDINDVFYNLEYVYPYGSHPSYLRYKEEESWTEWLNAKDEGEAINFKYNIGNYFYGSNLAAWQIWYSLDNDVERFAWADGRLYISKYGGYIIKRVREEDFVEEGQQYYAYLSEEDIIVCTKDEKISIGSIFYSANDISYEFGVVDDISGKGVIYRMIDEWNNDCPYDFKNIKFDRGVYDGGGFAPDGEEDMHFYLFTFSFRTDDNQIIDTSIFGNNGRLLNDKGQISGVYGNVIGQYMAYDGSIENPTKTTQRLNNIVFYSHYDYEGDVYYGCYNNSFGNNCYNNSFGNDCYSNSFGNFCYNNSFGNECYYNIFGNGCNFNSLGNCYYNNSFGDNCNNNTFKDRIGIADNFCYNKIDSEVYGVTFYADNDKGAYGMLRNHHICSGIGNVTIDLYADKISERTFTLDSNGILRSFILGDLASLL